MFDKKCASYYTSDCVFRAFVQPYRLTTNEEEKALITSDHTKDMWKTVDVLSSSDLHSNSGVRSDAFNLKSRVDNF